MRGLFGIAATAAALLYACDTAIDSGPVCGPPDAVMIETLPHGTDVAFTFAGAGEVFVAVAKGDVAAPPDASWVSSRAALLPPDGDVATVFARVDGGDPDCGTQTAMFRHTYTLRDGFSGGADDNETDAVPLDDPRISGWATGVVEPIAWGDDVDSMWRDPNQALGPATGVAVEVTSLGNGGTLTLTFDPPLADRPGPDLAVFENSVTDTFLELAFIEVSSDGRHFARFDAIYLGDQPVAAYGAHEPTLIGGLAGKYRAGFGTPFDLANLRYRQVVRDGRVALDHITQVRVVDIIGDGSTYDSLGQPIFDPTPTVGTGGFDLDGIAALGR